MTSFTISGSFSDSSSEVPALGSYRAAVYGSVSIGDTGRTPLAALYNASTGAVRLRLRTVRVSVSPKGSTATNDVCFILGATASGSVSGSAFTPTALSTSYPSSVAVPYGSVITGPTINDPMEGFLVPAQSQNTNWAPTPPILVADVNAQLLDRGQLSIDPGSSYVVSLSELSATTTTFAYIAEFSWDEVA